MDPNDRNDYQSVASKDKLYKGVRASKTQAANPSRNQKEIGGVAKSAGLAEGT